MAFSYSKRQDPKEVALMMVMRELKGDYIVRAEQNLKKMLREADVHLLEPNPQHKEFLFMSPIPEPFSGTICARVSFLTYRNFIPNTKKVLDDVVAQHRLCGTLHVLLTVARGHPYVPSDVKILALGTDVWLDQQEPFGWSPLLELGPNKRVLTFVRRMPANRARVTWSREIQHLMFEVVS